MIALVVAVSAVPASAEDVTRNGASVSVTSIAIRAEDGTSLPDSIPVDETFAVLITEDGSPVGAGTNVIFTLPYDTGDPVYLSTDDNGKVRYKPLVTGTLGIKVLDGTVTVANATVSVTTTGIQTLDSITISPDSADLLIGDTEPFTAICYDTSGNPMSSGYALTWACDTDAVGTIDSSGLFTAGGVGTATVTVTATQGYVTKTDTAIVDVSAPTEPVPVDDDDFSETIDAGAVYITVNGTFDNGVTGSIAITPVADPEETVGFYAFTGDDEALMGLTVTPDAAIAAELADGNGTIRIEICYNATELTSKGISSSTLAIYRYDGAAAAWVKMVAGTPPCIANGITGTCAWIEVNDLSTFALVGTKTTVPPSGGGGGGGTYPTDTISAADTDGDGVPDVWDVDNSTPSGYWVNPQGIGRRWGDMNGDGKLTSVDALMILQAAAGKIGL